MLPSFIVIGGQRCGTTSIFKALAEHPQVLRPAVEKGTDYFTLHYSHDVDWYRGHFPLRSVGKLRARSLGRPMAFEACTYYLFHPYALERLARDLPDVKLVAMLRNPVERAYSAYKHEVARGFEPERDFERALDLEPARLAGEDEKMRTDLAYESFSHRHHAYLSRGEYAEQLERATRYFPQDQIHVMESEAFFEHPGQEFTKLTRFLGLQDHLPARFDQHNARPGSAMPPAIATRLTEHYRRHDQQLTKFLGRPPHWLAAAG